MLPFPFQSAVNLVKAIKDRKITSVELLELYRDRYFRLNPAINAIVETDFENAGLRAQKADEALARGDNWGPLHGLPMTVKENVDVVGMHSTYGSPMFRENVAIKNADVVQSMEGAGAIIFGKTNLPLFMMDSQSFNEVYGQTNNPWDLTRTPGGSSGGSAAALASGMTSLEIGSDLGGSIRVPAHFCGVYGHKPSYGIVPIQGQRVPIEVFMIDHAPETDMVVIGPLARSAADLELAMDLLIRPPLPQRPAIRIELPPPRKKRLEEYRIGLWIDDPLFPPDTEVGDRLQNMVENLLKNGARIEEKKPDLEIKRCFEMVYELIELTNSMFLPKEVYDPLLQQSRALDPKDQSHEAWYARTVTKTHREWLMLNAERALMRQKWADYFKEIDLLLCPVARIAAFPHDHTDPYHRVTPFNGQDLSHGELIVPWTAMANVSYLPSTVAPIGTSSCGLPVGVQIIGPYLEDRTPIHFAKLLEESLGGFEPAGGII